MDIINLGDLSITNKNQNTILSFRIPSQKHVDYVEDHKKDTININKGGFRKK